MVINYCSVQEASFFKFGYSEYPSDQAIGLIGKNITCSHKFPKKQMSEISNETKK